MKSLAQIQCVKCLIRKPVSEFYEKSSKDSNPRTVCKACCNHADPIQLFLPGLKKCSRCGKIKSEEEFYKREGRRQSHCKECRYELHHTGNIARVKIWKENNPVRSALNFLVYTHKRRARKYGNGGSFTKDEWIRLINSFDGRCVCCGVSGKMNADHVVPVSKGGSSSIGNIQPLCRKCNQRKHTKTIDFRNNPFLGWDSYNQ